ncbi:MAG: LuxR C-terminal-related transcriptional regulator [Flavobacteriales bacterium]|nr:LuxR C-terminal-related transcriptional regulator [Flavobacteriales bacterium]
MDNDEVVRELQSLRVAVEGLTQVVLRMEAKGRGGLAGAEVPELTALTARQHAALQSLVYGLDTGITARIMGGISAETVKTHLRQVGKKMGVTKRGELRVMGQKFLAQGTDQEYMAATGGFGRTYMIETDVEVEDEMRSLIAPVKPGLLVTE